MINLVAAVSLHSDFSRERGQFMFRWKFCTPEGSWFESDYQPLSAARGVDSHLIREFTSKFNAWDPLSVKDFAVTIAYLEDYGKTVLASQVFIPAWEWAELHTAYTPFLSSKNALTEELILKHPSAEFCAVKRRKASAGQPFFALCRGRLWSSAAWVAPSVWIAHADSLFPSEAIADSGNGRRISVDVRREVWRRDSGRCVRCNSRERLEYDHIVPFAEGGSSTVRNIELLCETCNRQKSSAIR